AGAWQSRCGESAGSKWSRFMYSPEKMRFAPDSPLEEAGFDMLPLQSFLTSILDLSDLTDNKAQPAPCRAAARPRCSTAAVRPPRCARLQDARRAAAQGLGGHAGAGSG